MLARSLPLGLLVVLLASLATPAAGHGAPNPLDNEIHILQDESNDGYLFADGYDLYDLFVREAYWAPLDQLGLIFRFQLYGGATTPAVEAQHIDIAVGTPDGDKTFRLTTLDDVTWEGDLLIVEADSEPDLGTSYTHQIQAFVSLEQLGIQMGDSITDIRMASWIDDQLIDVAPGGHYVPGAETDVEDPVEGSHRYVEELTIVGPSTYTLTAVHGENGRLKLEVKSQISKQGQHIAVVIPKDQPWELGDVELAHPNLEANGNLTLTLPATPLANGVAPLVIHIDTDVGGRETVTVTLGPDGFYETEENEIVRLPTDDIAESSATALPFITLAVLALLATGRRP